MERRTGLLLVTAALAGLAVVILGGVVGTVFFAITLGYVLFPVRERLIAHGMSHRLASGLLTLGVFLAVIGLMIPPAFVLFERREAFIAFLQTLPPVLSVGPEGLVFSVQTADLVAGVRAQLTGVALAVARDAVIIALKLVLFAFVLYALLFSPGGIRRAATTIVPDGHHDVLEAFHERTSRTLYGLYVVQVLTGALTFLIALPVFFLLGYEAYFTLSLISGILQFVPVVGPSVVVLALGVLDFMTGAPVRAGLVVVVGLVVIGFLPDAILRPRLASRTAGLPASLYFIGFTGGVLSLGPIGIIAGPLIIALVLEAVAQLSADEVDRPG